MKSIVLFMVLFYASDIQVFATPPVYSGLYYSYAVCNPFLAADPNQSIRRRTRRPPIKSLSAGHPNDVKRTKQIADRVFRRCSSSMIYKVVSSGLRLTR